MKWHAHRDWAGWSFGWYPTDDDPRMLILQNIRWWSINLDIGETRISWLHREYTGPPWKEPEPRRRGLKRLVIDR